MDLIRDLNPVFQEVFDDPSLEVGPEMTAADVDDWDSVSHITLICAIEEKFSVNFTTREIASLNSVGDLVKLLGTKLGHN